MTALAEPSEPQAANPTVAPTALEPEILSEINRVRTDPQGYARWLEEQQQYYDGIWLKLPGEKAVRTNKGRKALEEAIATLKTQQPLPPLSISEQTAATATNKLEDFATANNIQYISYGRVTAKGIVMGLVVDDLFPDRRRRNNLLNPDVENTGVVCKPDPRYARVCAIAYSDTETNIAEAQPSDPPPEVTTAALNPEISDSQTDRSSPDTTPSVEVTPTPPEDNSDAELPLPPQPQAPPVLPTHSEPGSETAAEPPEVEVSEADSVEVETAETETEEVEVEEVEVPLTDEDVEVETAETEELEEIEKIEVPVANEDVEVEPAEVETEELEIEESVDSQEVEVSQAEETQVAVNSDNTDLLEQIERGSLEQGDRVISDDGSFYDSYPIEGKAGESFNIYLESDEFDAFVALIDAKGNIVEQNDDISQEDSNSRIRVTLPEDGVYNVIVNTYDEGGTGKYVLTVSR